MRAYINKECFSFAEKIRIFLKKSAGKFAGKQEMAYLCTRNQENNLLRKEKEIIERLT